MNVLSLFSGIGGLELGLERSGMRVVGQVEIDPFCQRVLAKHWPEVPRHDDVRTAVEWWRAEPRPGVDLVAGGFPCQPFSHAGKRLGVADERWGWPWMRDVIRAIRPRYVICENVAALLRDAEAFSVVLSDLSHDRFAVEWDVVSACSVGAPHPRSRLFTVAYADILDGQSRLGIGEEQRLAGLAGRQSEGAHGCPPASSWRDRVDWSVEAAGADGRDADGLAAAMVGALGNAVVPQVAEYVGRLIMSAEGVWS
jgi:DNA (cytosine-5)-methyltransferase 1